MVWPVVVAWVVLVSVVVHRINCRVDVATSLALGVYSVGRLIATRGGHTRQVPLHPADMRERGGLTP